MKRASRSDPALVHFTRALLGAAGFAAALLFFRSLPDLVRYLKMERM